MSINKSWFKTSMSFKVAGLITFAILSVLILTPRKVDVLKADNTICTNSTTPIFNPYQISDTPGGCYDYAFMRAQVIHNGAKSGFTTGSVQAQAGDQVEVVLYIDNGAATGSDALRNIQLNTSASLNAGSSHSVSASVTASNAANSLSGNVNIATPDGSSLLVNSDTGQWFESTNFAGNFGNVINKTTNLPDQQACFPYVRFIYLVFDVKGSVAQAAPSGQISATVGGLIPGAQCLKTGLVTWSTQNVVSDEITVQSPNETQGEHFFATNMVGSNLTNPSPWLQSEHTYIFILYDTSNGRHVELARVSETIPPFSCGSAPVALNCTVSPSVANVGDTVTFTATGGNGNYGWVITDKNPSVGASVITTFSTPGTKSATLSDNDSSHQAGHCSVVINTPNVVTPLTCSANVSSGNVNDQITFTATGGKGVYSWSTSSNSNAGSGNPFIVTFGSAGNKTVTVSDGSQSANCGVVINALNSNLPVYNQGNCNATNSCNNYPTYNNTNNNCVNNSCNYTYNNTTTNSGYQYPTYPTYNPPVYYPVYNPPVYNPPVYAAAAAPAVLGGNVSLAYSKRAFNETKGADATSVAASREDYITYTLTVTNSGNTPSNNFVITDDLSGVLNYSDIVDNGGGSINGNIVSYPALTVPAGGSASASFKVRVKYNLVGNTSYTMTNTYGNTVNVKINSNPQVLGAFVAPKTGADTEGFMFAAVLTAAFAVFKKRKSLAKLIFT